MYTGRDGSKNPVGVEVKGSEVSNWSIGVIITGNAGVDKDMREMEKQSPKHTDNFYSNFLYYRVMYITKHDIIRTLID